MRARRWGIRDMAVAREVMYRIWKLRSMRLILAWLPRDSWRALPGVSTTWSLPTSASPTLIYHSTPRSSLNLVYFPEQPRKDTPPKGTNRHCTVQDLISIGHLKTPLREYPLSLFSVTSNSENGMRSMLSLSEMVLITAIGTNTPTTARKRQIRQNQREENGQTCCGVQEEGKGQESCVSSMAM
jgi:hypothetical protein